MDSKCSKSACHSRAVHNMRMPAMAAWSRRDRPSTSCQGHNGARASTCSHMFDLDHRATPQMLYQPRDPRLSDVRSSILGIDLLDFSLLQQTQCLRLRQGIADSTTYPKLSGRFMKFSHTQRPLQNKNV